MHYPSHGHAVRRDESRGVRNGRARVQQYQSNGSHPVPGRFAQIREVWRWRPLFKSWADYWPGGHREFDLKVTEKLRPESIADPGKMEHMIDLF